jgi:monoamine oxidase
MPPDVIVVGAGAAGLAAARALYGAGLHTIILEARDRIGGRVFTIHDPLTPVPIELGAEFIHGRPPELWNITRSAALPVADAVGDRWCFDQSLRRCDDLFAKFDKVLDGLENSQEKSFEEYIRECDYDERDKAWAIAYVEGFNACTKEDVSVRWLAESQKAAEAIDGDRLFRPLSGYDRVIMSLSSGLEDERAPIYLNTPVSSVQWQPGSVTVSAGPRSFSAKRAVITVPLGVLQHGAIRFDPEPENLKRALAAMAMGPVVRITFRFHEAFWHDRKDLEQLGFLHSLDEWVPTWWTSLPVHAPVITGWSAGPAAKRMMQLDEHGQIDQAVQTLARLLERDPKQLQQQVEACYVHDWNHDPYARGAYSYVRPGGLDEQRMLAKPVEHTLYFAGEAAEAAPSGTVHGAIMSGMRAARELLSDFKR